MRLSLVVMALACAGASVAGAQRCRVNENTNEAKLLAFYTAPLSFSMAVAPGVTTLGSIRVGAEGEYVPKPDPSIQQTGACFTQKDENTSLSPVFGRPRITIGGPAGFSIELAYLPPVTIARARPNLLSFAVAHSSHVSAGPTGGTTIMLRGHGTYGSVKGAITCPAGSLQQTAPASPCFGTEASEDTFRPDMFGGEIAVGVTPGTRGLSFYAGVGANRIDPRFQVGFTDGNGNVDTTRVELQESLTRATAFGGVTATVRRVFDIGAQIYSVPADATVFKLNGGFRFR